MQKLNYFLKNPQTNWKYILIVVILAFFAGGGILGYQYWWLPRVQDETANWKIYRNEEYGFELKYPPNFFIDVETEREVHWAQEQDAPWILSIYINSKPDIEKRDQFPYRVIGEGQTASGSYVLVEDPITMGPDVFRGWIVSDQLSLEVVTAGLPFDSFKLIVLNVTF